MSRGTQTIFFAISLIALLAVIAARLTGPSDIYEKDQPKTMSYTTDIILHGRWILPTEVGGSSATKPPLYNWLAAPFVAAHGTDSEIAHRFPSILAFIGCWLVLIIIGCRMNAPAVGCIAALAFILNAAMYKLGFLARTDSLLTFFLILGWLLATELTLRAPDRLAASHRIMLQLAFWLTVALAALTKGPPALVLVLYALLAPRIITGSWSNTRSFAWPWGVPLAIAPFAAWIIVSYIIDPDHVVNQLWGQEFAGRLTGLGEEGSRRGPLGFIYGLFHMPVYYLSRFLPWSILSILAIIELRRDRSSEANVAEGTQRLWLIAATTFLLIIIVFFTLSTGKRAAYIAAAYGPGAVLAAGWIVWLFTKRNIADADPADRGFLLTCFTAAAAALIFTALVVYDRRDAQAPTPGFGDAIVAFIDQSAEMIRDESRDGARGAFLLWEFDHLLLRAMLGGPFIGVDEAADRLASNETVWVFTSGDAGDAFVMHGLIASLNTSIELRAQPVLSSQPLPPAFRWPEQVTLWRISPR